MGSLGGASLVTGELPAGGAALGLRGELVPLAHKTLAVCYEPAPQDRVVAVQRQLLLDERDVPTDRERLTLRNEPRNTLDPHL